MLEQPVQLRAQAPGAAGAGPGLLHLPEDLGFSQHQRVQARGDAEQVPRRVRVHVAVQVILQRGAFLAGLPRQPAGDRFAAILVLGNGIDLGAVAGRQHRRLAHAVQATQLREGTRQRRVGERHALAQADRRSLVVDAED